MRKLVTLTGPRGTGKGTLIDQLTSDFTELRRLVNFTTREPRPNETEGIEYYFITKEYFYELSFKDQLACHSQIGKIDDPKVYFNGIMKSEMDRHEIGIVDKAAMSARKLEAYSDETLKLFVFSTYSDRLMRLRKNRKLPLSEAMWELEKEPSPARDYEEALNLYPDFSIITNEQGKQEETFAEAYRLVQEFLR